MPHRPPASANICDCPCKIRALTPAIPHRPAFPPPAAENSAPTKDRRRRQPTHLFFVPAVLRTASGASSLRSVSYIFFPDRQSYIPQQHHRRDSTAACRGSPQSTDGRKYSAALCEDRHGLGTVHFSQTHAVSALWSRTDVPRPWQSSAATHPPAAQAPRMRRPDTAIPGTVRCAHKKVSFPPSALPILPVSVYVPCHLSSSGFFFRIPCIRTYFSV